MSEQLSYEAQDEAEVFLLRLFRCLPEHKRSHFFVKLGHECLQEYCVNDTDFIKNEQNTKAVKDKDDVEELEWRLQRSRRDSFGVGLDLDNLGDADIFLEKSFGEPFSELIFNDSSHDGYWAEILATDFINESRRSCSPLPMDFDEKMTEEDLQDDIEMRFSKFITNWRESVITTLEKQIPLNPQ